MGVKSFGLRYALLMSAAAFGFGLSAITAVQPAYAQEATRSYNIPAQNLGDALREFGRQSGRDVLFTPDSVANKRSPGVHGAMTERDALQAVLSGSGLRFEQTGSGGYAVQDPNSPTRLGDASQSAAPSDEAVSEEITVIGTNMRGVYPASSPIQIYTQQDIQRSGATTTEQFIEKLPQNLGTRSTYGSYAIGGIAGIANSEIVAGANLRGLGTGATLTLLNGRRLGLADFGRTADLSLIPQSAIERVEVLTDGASAIYGSDAIGGVVNFVLRRDFDGAETRVSYGGVSEGNFRQGDFSQTFGRTWNSGSGLISYSAYSASPLNVTDRPYAAGVETGTLTPVEQRQSLLATFSQTLSDQLSISGDVVFSRRDIKMQSATTTLTSANPLNWVLVTTNNTTNQAVYNLSLDYEFSHDLHAAFKATHAETDVDSGHYSELYHRTPPTFTLSAPNTRNYSATDLTAVVDGTLFALPGGRARFSSGAGVLDEDYSGAGQQATTTVNGTLGRRTTYAFGELFLPFIGEEQSVPLVRRLELTLAARYTKYDDQSNPARNQEFGDNTDPRVGLLWTLFEPFSMRATYGTSFRAPSVIELDDSAAVAQLLSSGISIPFPAGPHAALFRTTSAPADNLGPETATTRTIGFDIRPHSHPRFRISGTYYNISYEGRIATPPGTLLQVLQAPNLFPTTIYHPPSAQYIQDLITSAHIFFGWPGGGAPADPVATAQALFAGNTYIWDTRTRNLSASKQDGADLSISNGFASPWGEVRYGLDLTRIFSYRQQTDASSAAVTTVDRATYPSDLRGRGFVGFSRGGFDGALGVNYVDDYRNVSSATGGPARIESWTTVDLSLAYDFGAHASRSDGVRLQVSVQNLFDQDPPFVGGGTLAALYDPIGFDAANANPYGRLVVVGLSKSW